MAFNSGHTFAIAIGEKSAVYTVVPSAGGGADAYVADAYGDVTVKGAEGEYVTTIPNTSDSKKNHTWYYVAIG